MRCIAALLVLIGVGTVPSTALAKSGCPTDMYDLADASLAGAAASWGSLSRHQRRFLSCDDGAMAEGYSDTVVTLLAYRWEQFGAFAALSQRNPAFGRWAIRHIDATASTDDLMKVVRNATKCTGSASTKALCREVATAAKEALKD